MIPVPRPTEPPTFDRDCRAPGNRWLAANPTSAKIPSLWRDFNSDLRAGFSERCGWWAMWISEGQVDHYLSQKNHRHLAYEWSNYRYISSSLNSSKVNLDDQVLDPFEVQTGWFEVLLPSLLLICTNQVPAHLRARADFTITRLHLVSGTKIRENRKRHYKRFKEGKVTLSGLQDDAPLIADAIIRWNRDHPNQPLP